LLNTPKVGPSRSLACTCFPLGRLQAVLCTEAASSFASAMSTYTCAAPPPRSRAGVLLADDHDGGNRPSFCPGAPFQRVRRGGASGPQVWPCSCGLPVMTRPCAQLPLGVCAVCLLVCASRLQDKARTVAAVATCHPLVVWGCGIHHSFRSTCSVMCTTAALPLRPLPRLLKHTVAALLC
jgi:hypothetical protein